MSSYWKTVFRTIRESLPRFLAIFAIIALGVGFFAGLKMTSPSFYKTADSYTEEYRLYDFKLLSTIGFDDDDIESLSKVQGVQSVEGAVYQDAILLCGDTSSTVRIHTITSTVNQLELTAGRMPQSPDEIVIDGYKNDAGMIGKTLTLSQENTAECIDTVRPHEFTVVGLVRSPMYMNFQRGTTDAGSGAIDYYAYVQKDSLDADYYTEAYVYCNTGLFIYSDEYKDWAAKEQDILEAAVKDIIDVRFDSVMDDSSQELSDGIDEFNEQREDAYSELEDARETLETAYGDITDSQRQIDDGRAQLEDAGDELEAARVRLEETDNQLKSTKATLDSASSQLDSTESQLEAAKAQLDSTAAQLSSGQSAIDDARSQLEAARTQTDGAIAALNDSITGLSGKIAELGAEIDAADADPSALPADTDAMKANLAQLQLQLQSLEDNLNTAKAGQQELAAQQSALDDSQSTLDSGKAAYEDAIAQYNSGSARYSAAKAAYESGLAQYSSGLEQYNEGLDAYNSGVAEYNQNAAELDSAQDKVDSAFKDYYDGRHDYFAGVCKYETEISEAFRMNIAYGCQQLDNIERPDTYVLGRDKNVGYVCFDNDAKIVDGVASVFPVFFFAIAALVCSTTMSRMVADERGHIGTMRALGFSESAIIMKYVVYSGAASVLGCVLGYIGGIKLFPWVIWEVYAMMYGFADISFANEAWMFIMSFAISLVCTVGVTVVTCVTELNGMPAELIRPKTPAAGKRILLERITFIWKRMKFLYKVSARNVFRFKKRMMMMIVGIAGCTALLITAFGLYDSICNVVGNQYDRIMKFDIDCTFAGSYNAEGIKEAANEANHNYGKDFRYAVAEYDTAHNDGGGFIRDVGIYVADGSDVEGIFGLENFYTGDSEKWPADGEVAISSKLAEKNNVRAGDNITLTYGDDSRQIVLRVAYVFKNYTYHYCFMTPATYEAAFGQSYDPSDLLVMMNDSTVSPYDYARYLTNNYNLKSCIITNDERESFSATMEKMNYVIILVVSCAAALAFIVLFNLNNINITERIREIATLKVMGFYRKETGSYVFRENVILVFLGYLTGIPLGFALHRFVMSQIEMDMVIYDVRIAPQSFAYALVLVLLFSAIADMAMHRRIDRIDMAESLKSIE